MTLTGGSHEVVNPATETVERTVALASLAETDAAIATAQQAFESWRAGNLVGTPEQVARSLGAYYRLGVSTFLIRGFDPLDDALAYGRDLIPAIHAHVAELDQHHAAATA